MFDNHIAQLAILSFYIYFNFKILRKKSRRQECLDWIITWISYHYSKICEKLKCIIMVIKWYQKNTWYKFHGNLCYCWDEVTKVPEQNTSEIAALHLTSSDVHILFYLIVIHLVLCLLFYYSIESVFRVWELGKYWRKCPIALSVNVIYIQYAVEMASHCLRMDQTKIKFARVPELGY